MMGGGRDKQPGARQQGDAESVGAAARADDAAFFAASPPLTPAWNQESWAAVLLENARQFGVQLVCAGGSGAIAKTAVAPLERAKVRPAAGGAAALLTPGACRCRGGCSKGHCPQQQLAPTACGHGCRPGAAKLFACRLRVGRRPHAPRRGGGGPAPPPPPPPSHRPPPPPPKQILAQVHPMGAAAAGGPGRSYKGPWDALWRMRRAEGGWQVRMRRSSLPTPPRGLQPPGPCLRGPPSPAPATGPQQRSRGPQSLAAPGLCSALTGSGRGRPGPLDCPPALAAARRSAPTALPFPSDTRRRTPPPCLSN
jgi:hypothetical protein